MATIGFPLGVVVSLSNLFLDLADVFLHGAPCFLPFVTRDLAGHFFHGTLDLVLRTLDAIVIHANSPQACGVQALRLYDEGGRQAVTGLFA